MKLLASLLVLLLALALVPSVGHAQERCTSPACIQPPTSTGGLGGSLQGALINVLPPSPVWGDPDQFQLLIGGPDITVGDPDQFGGPDLSISITPPPVR
jgi:hypothetical protein